MSSDKAARFYKPELDTLRFFAFLAVYVHHALPQQPALYVQKGIPGAVALWLAAAVRAGGFGVDLFFVLSAYLITELLLRELELRGRLGVRAFYVRRALRIWPLYYAFLAFAIFVAPSILARESFAPHHEAAYLLFVGNWGVVHWGYPASVAAPLWSVSIEEQFYLAWPLLLALVGARRLVAAAWTMIAVAIGARAYLALGGAVHPAIWCNTLARLDPIAGGALLACLLRNRTLAPSTLVRLAAAVSAVLLANAVALWLPLDGWAASAAFPLVAVAAILATLSILGSDAAWTRSRLLVYLGRISYGLYVFHLLGLALVDRVRPTAGLGLRVVGGFAATLALSALSYALLERPFLRLKERFSVIASRPEGR